MNSYKLIFIFCSLLLLFFSIWKELKRPNRKRLLLRLIATLIAVCSLTALCFTFTYNSVINHSSSSQKWIFLTEGYNKDSVRLFMKNEKITDTCSGNFLHQLQLHSYKQAVVFGHGFVENELQQLQPYTFDFKPSISTKGITAVQWKEVLNKGELLSIQGMVRNNAKSKMRLYLQAFGNNVDSATIQAFSNQSFGLSTLPKQTGRIVYSLLLMHNQDTIEYNPVPFQVIAPQALQILMLASAPNFEQKFLKNWCIQQQYTVTTQTLISKNKYVNTFSNTSNKSMNKINGNLLNDIDVLLLDASIYNSLSKFEQQIIYKYIVEKEMGCILLSDTTINSKTALSGYFSIQNNNTIPKPIHLLFAQKKALVTPSYSLYTLKENETQLSLVKDSIQQVYAAVQLVGKGKFINTTISETYPWMLQGNNEIYHQYWSHLFNAVLPSQVSQQFYILPFIHLQQQPVNFQINTANENPIITINNNQVAALQIPYQQNSYQAIYWPNKVGWQTLRINNDSTLYWYTYSKNAFKQVQATQKIQVTQAFCNDTQLQQTSSSTKSVTVQKIIPPYFFVILFFVTASFLWWERKWE